MSDQYVTKDEILALARSANPYLTSSDISDALFNFVNGRIEMELALRHVYDGVSSSHSCYKHVKNAALCYAMEFLNYVGKIRWGTGDMARLREGNFDIEFQRWQPMFFFAQGDSQKFNNLLPHETWRMMANKFMDAFAQCYFYKENRIQLAIWRDRTLRGRGALDAREYYVEN